MQYLTPRQFAAKMGIHYTTVYRKIKEGEIKTKVLKKEIVRIPWDETKMSGVK